MLIAFILLALISWLIFVYLRQKDETSTIEHNDCAWVEPPLSKRGQAHTKLDTDIFEMLTTRETDFQGDPACSRTINFVRQLINSEVRAQLERRVNASALIPEEDPLEGIRRQQENERLIKAETVRSIMLENGISEDWLLANGGFKPTPWHEKHPSPEIDTQFWNSLSDGARHILLLGRQKSADEWRKYEDECCFTSNHHHFGWPLEYTIFENIPATQLQDIIQHKGKFIEKFRLSKAKNNTEGAAQI